MLTIQDVLETNQMIQKNNLDVRTITMGISLLDCCSADSKTLCKNIYDKVTKYGEHLVKTGEDISAEYGVPIINKRVAVTPIAMVAGCSDLKDYVAVARALDKARETIGIDFIGGFSALVERGYTEGDRRLIASIPEALATTELVCSSVGIGSTKAGINMLSSRSSRAMKMHPVQAVAFIKGGAFLRLITIILSLIVVLHFPVIHFGAAVAGVLSFKVYTYLEVTAKFVYTRLERR